MAKSPFSNPFVARPAAASPLASTARAASAARGIRVESVEELDRSGRLAAELQSGGENLGPKFKPVATIAPFETVTPVAIPVEPVAGGSKT
jgi:hypothetical protein